MTDYCTLPQVTEYINLGGQGNFPPTDDQLLSRLITEASEWLDAWLGIVIKPTAWQEIQDGTGGDAITLTNRPIISVELVKVDSVAIPAAPVDGGYRRGYLFTTQEIILRGAYFCRRRQNIIVNYTAGYAATPAPITQACIELVALRYRQRQRLDVRSMSQGTMAHETTTYSEADMSKSTRLNLNPYRRVEPVRAFVTKL